MFKRLMGFAKGSPHPTLLSQIVRAPKPKSLARNNEREAAKAINAPLAARGV